MLQNENTAQIKIAICDDSSSDISLARAAVERFFSANSFFDAQIYEYISPLDFLSAFYQHNGFDITLLDICLPGMLGTEVAKEIRQSRENAEIIFLTTSDEYAVDAFALKAAHYLIKPVQSNAFDEALERCLLQIEAKKTKRIAFRSNGGALRIVHIDEIEYVESYAHTQTVYLRSGENIEIRASLIGLQQQLCDAAKKQFIMPYKGFLVNQNAIKIIEKNGITLASNAIIPISRRNLKELQDNYFNYIFDE